MSFTQETKARASKLNAYISAIAASNAAPQDEVLAAKARDLRAELDAKKIG